MANICAYYKNPKSCILPRSAELTFIETYYTQGKISIQEAAKKGDQITSAIDKAVADSSLTDTQKALYAACKQIYANKNLTIKQTKENIEAAIAAAHKANPGDSEAVKSLVIKAIHSQIKADKAASA
uniref:HTH_Tnp_1_2 domain-containing protein n=1 Tax=Rhabditophanes sp. KR3021 TaxID=114890 RepID=A0AC35U2V1_9BILA